MKLTRRIGLAAAGAATAGTLLIALAPAASAADTASGAEHAATVVEKATGTGDLAPSGVIAGAAAKATISTGAGDVTVTAPHASAGDVRATAADGSSIGLGLTGAGNVTGTKAGRGTVVYSGVARSTDFAVQPTTDGGARALVTLKDASAPTEQKFALRLPQGARVLPDGSGGYKIVKPSGDGIAVTAGTIAAPWAKDANGNPVATSYTLDGDTLVQRVETNSDTAFPVVADPKFTWGNVTGTAYLTRAETKDIAIYGSTAAIAVGALPPPLNVLYRVNAALVTAKAVEANSNENCLSIKFAAGVFIPGEYGNGCN